MADAKPTKLETEFKAADDKVVRLVVHKPSPKDEAEAELEYARVFTKLFREKALLEAEVEAAARERGLVTDAHVAERKRLAEAAAADEKVVKGKVKGTTKAEGRAAALRLITAKAKLDDLDGLTAGLDRLTAEYKAREARYDTLLHRCTRHADTGKVYFTSADEVGQRADDDPAKKAANAALMKVAYDYDPVEKFKARSEIAFLLKFGFAQLSEDGKFKFTDPATGAEVDADGNPVEKEDGATFDFED